MVLRTTRYFLLLSVFVTPGSFAEVVPAMTMTGMRPEPVTQTTEALVMTGLAPSKPVSVNVTAPQPKKK